jgi:hypothetical protein
MSGGTGGFLCRPGSGRNPAVGAMTSRTSPSCSQNAGAPTPPGINTATVAAEFGDGVVSEVSHRPPPVYAPAHVVIRPHRPLNRTKCSAYL